MENIQIKNTFSGSVIFEHQKENNTVTDTVIELLKEFKGQWVKEIDLSNIDLSNIDFSNIKLDNIKFDNTNFDNITFENSTFLNNIFVNNTFHNCKFYNNTFYDSTFYNTKFYKNTFDSCKFYNNTIDSCAFNDSLFNNAKLDKSIFDNSTFDDTSEINKNCDLSKCIFIETKFNKKRYIQISCIGSEKRLTTYCFEDDTIWCGCFKGSLLEFENKVKETYKNNQQYLKEYSGAITYLKYLI